MVKFALPLIALAMAGSVAAAPAPATSATTFSFEKWVEDIIANPDTALSVDEAIAAAEAADVVGSAGGLQRRVACEQGWARAPGRDAVACVNQLASRGKTGGMCGLPANEFSKLWCKIGGAGIWGTKSNQGAQTANCNDVARTAGIIFDNCWRSDDTISGSEICITNNLMQVNIKAAT